MGIEAEVTTSKRLSAQDGNTIISQLLKLRSLVYFGLAMLADIYKGESTISIDYKIHRKELSDELLRGETLISLEGRNDIMDKLLGLEIFIHKAHRNQSQIDRSEVDMQIDNCHEVDDLLIELIRKIELQTELIKQKK
ncbi:MAG: hypothetical protein M1338_05420 [Patescibacteria group bacterium]|nr:hypothetical protein [Patescibacteria group bacterium]